MTELLSDQWLWKPLITSSRSFLRRYGSSFGSAHRPHPTPSGLLSVRETTALPQPPGESWRKIEARAGSNSQHKHTSTFSPGWRQAWKATSQCVRFWDTLKMHISLTLASKKKKSVTNWLCFMRSLP